MKNIYSFFVVFACLLTFQSWNQVKGANITFEVDMTGQVLSANGVHIVGSLNGWNPSSNELLSVGGNIYAVTLPLADNKYYEFKFLNGNSWGAAEEIVPAQVAISTNRFLITPVSDVTVRYQFSGLPLAGLTKTTFTLDLSGQTVTGPVRLVGNFTDWNPNTCVMAQIGTTLSYSRTMYLIPSLTYEYKFINSGTDWAGIENLAGLSCVNGSSNRFFTLPVSETVIENIFDGCTTPTALAETQSNKIELFPLPVVNQLSLSGLVGDASVQVINSVGSVVKSLFISGDSNVTVDFSNLSAGLYLVQISNNNRVTVQKITKQ